MTTDGHPRLLIPDKPTERVYLFDQFTYNDQRELVEFAHDVLDLLQHAEAHWQPRINARTRLANEPRAQHQLMRDDLRLLGRLAQDGQEKSGKAHGACD